MNVLGNGLVLALALGFVTQQPGDQARLTPGDLHMGRWRAVLSVPGGELAFGLEFAADGDRVTAALVNGAERVAIDSVTVDGDALRLRLPAFNSTIQAHLVDGAIQGTLTLVKRGGVEQVISLRAEFAEGFQFELPGSVAIDATGRWDVRFTDDEGVQTRAVGEFHQEGTAITGTFLTPTGDYRYLAGSVVARDFSLSCFDGAHAFLFKGTMQSDQTIRGEFWSGLAWHETWVARRQDAATLPDAYSLTHLKPGYDRLAFSFPDVNGRVVALDDARFAGRVVVVQLAGTWCPNCHDETAFLSRFYEARRDLGLEVIGLLYEHYRDFERAATQARRFRDKFQLKYELLVAGYSDKTEAAATLPMLDHVLSFPTLIVVDRRGAVRRIHTGFSGPGTGSHYDEFVAEFSALVDSLLLEK